MAYAPAAVAASKSFDHYRQVRKAGNQITFIIARKRPGSEHRSGFAQGVDVLMSAVEQTYLTLNDPLGVKGCDKNK